MAHSKTLKLYSRYFPHWYKQIAAGCQVTKSATEYTSRLHLFTLQVLSYHRPKRDCIHIAQILEIDTSIVQIQVEIDYRFQQDCAQSMFHEWLTPRQGQHVNAHSCIFLWCSPILKTCFWCVDRTTDPSPWVRMCSSTHDLRTVPIKFCESVDRYIVLPPHWINALTYGRNSSSGICCVLLPTCHIAECAFACKFHSLAESCWHWQWSQVGSNSISSESHVPCIAWDRRIKPLVERLILCVCYKVLRVTLRCIATFAPPMENKDAFLATDHMSLHWIIPPLSFWMVREPLHK
jgi:hypothetical protein